MGEQSHLWQLEVMKSAPIFVTSISIAPGPWAACHRRGLVEPGQFDTDDLGPGPGRGPFNDVLARGVLVAVDEDLITRAERFAALKPDALHRVVEHGRDRLCGVGEEDVVLGPAAGERGDGSARAVCLVEELIAVEADGLALDAVAHLLLGLDDGRGARAERAVIQEDEVGIESPVVRDSRARGTPSTIRPVCRERSLRRVSRPRSGRMGRRRTASHGWLRGLRAMGSARALVQ